MNASVPRIDKGRSRWAAQSNAAPPARGKQTVIMYGVLLVAVQPALIVSTRSSLCTSAWLAARFRRSDEQDIIVFDVTQKLDRNSNSASPDVEAFEAGRIPGARFLDVGSRLSRPELRNARGDLLHNMLPDAEQFASEMAAAGVKDGSHVVLYSSGHVMWATRVWWLLHSFGFQGHVSVLDGGLDAWTAAGCPVERGAPASPPVVMPSFPGAAGLAVRQCRTGAMVDKYAVLEAIQSPRATVIDSLKPATFSGAEPSRYGRRGHITSAVNIPYPSVVDSRSGCFFPSTRIREAFKAASVALDGDGLLLAY